MIRQNTPLSSWGGVMLHYITVKTILHLFDPCIAFWWRQSDDIVHIDGTVQIQKYQNVIKMVFLLFLFFNNIKQQTGKSNCCWTSCTVKIEKCVICWGGIVVHWSVFCETSHLYLIFTCLQCWNSRSNANRKRSDVNVNALFNSVTATASTVKK